jgi:nucleoid-associated protein YgaU
VTVLKLIPFGDPVDGRFTGGKAIIRRGDTLWSIAHRYYGSGIHYRTIFKANRDLISRPSRIYPGQIFDLPLVTEE